MNAIQKTICASLVLAGIASGSASDAADVTREFAVGVDEAAFENLEDRPDEECGEESGGEREDDAGEVLRHRPRSKGRSGGGGKRESGLGKRTEDSG